jgi:hypothetical protein
MPSDQSPVWLLKKHGTGNVHGPVPFEKLLEWAYAAQINPQDSVSNDGKTWTKAPMIEELHMDWLVEAPDNPLYGPTTSGALLEFLNMGEINACTRIVNCCTGKNMSLAESPFYEEMDPALLKKRIAQLEGEVRIATKTIARLETRIAELERSQG